MNNPVIFEQPLNETIRLCLILEQLLQQARESVQSATTIHQTQHAVNTIIKLIQIIERPDLKGKLTKALSQHAAHLAQLENNTQVCQTTLSETLAEVDALADAMHAKTANFTQDLKSQPLLKSVLQYSNTPGGPAYFHIPNYHLWLHQDNLIKQSNMLDWLRCFDLVQKCCATLLRLTRLSTNFHAKQAVDSFYQQNLSAQPVTQLIRVKISDDMGVWPEISVGRHRLAIYFVSAQDANKSSVSFELACCY